MRDKIKRAEIRQLRVRKKMIPEGNRLVISRSNRFLFAQVIESETGRVLLGLMDKKLLSEKESKGKTKSEKARIFGEKFAQEALKRKIKKVRFDRGAYCFHGRVKAFAEGARAGGLEF